MDEAETDTKDGANDQIGGGVARLSVTQMFSLALEELGERDLPMGYKVGV